MSDSFVIPRTAAAQAFLSVRELKFYLHSKRKKKKRNIIEKNVTGKTITTKYKKVNKFTMFKIEHTKIYTIRQIMRH